MHGRIGAFTASSGVSALYTRGGYAAAVAAGARREGMPPDKVHVFSDVDEVLAYVRSRIKKGDWILVKGSRKMRMETVVREILDTFGKD